jgi:hypothetical protein
MSHQRLVIHIVHDLHQFLAVSYLFLVLSLLRSSDQRKFGLFSPSVFLVFPFSTLLQPGKISGICTSVGTHEKLESYHIQDWYRVRVRPENDGPRSKSQSEKMGEYE